MSNGEIKALRPHTLLLRWEDLGSVWEATQVGSGLQLCTASVEPAGPLPEHSPSISQQRAGSSCGLQRELPSAFQGSPLVRILKL